MPTYFKPFSNEHSGPVCPSSYNSALSSLSSSYCENRKEVSIYWIQVNKEEREVTCVSVRFLDLLGVSQALPCSVATAEDIIFLLESTHPPTSMRASLVPSPTPFQVHLPDFSQICHFYFLCINHCVTIFAWFVTSIPNLLSTCPKDLEQLL